ncbi:STAS domain-containing protein [Aquihabitans sp. G128]|uniref:STAS domain-containing protein n=1 Tax=Aquihabitans sp. G128 TaxID=2849779 RepID=UPI001C2231AC|nr:STAS domain-containing protein [Aquihabitans sp. G128]QXC62113.1 STAS domain-containing protein [Aquihabitans sp. G128]
MPFPPLTITAAAGPGTELLALSGEIDLATSHLLVDAIDAAIAAGAATVVLDFAEVTFVNSTGLGAMVAATKRLRLAGGDLVLRHFRGIPASALATTGLDRFFTIDS